MQLKCSKYHIFHEHCIRSLLSGHPSSLPRCPLCRKPMEIRDEISVEERTGVVGLEHGDEKPGEGVEAE